MSWTSGDREFDHHGRYVDDDESWTSGDREYDPGGGGWILAAGLAVVAMLVIVQRCLL